MRLPLPQALKALHSCIIEPRFSKYLINSGFAAQLKALSLGTCGSFASVQMAHTTTYNLEHCALALQTLQQQKATELELKQWTWPFTGKQLDDNDKSGILYYIGTNAYTKPWANPHTTSAVLVTSSSLEPDSLPAHAILNRGSDAGRVVSKNLPGQSFQVDFKTTLVKASHYTLRHYASSNQEVLRNWELQGSLDGRTWHTLSVHEEDTKLKAAHQCATWEIPPPASKQEGGSGGYYRVFRVIQTGHNSNRSDYLALAGFEIYGSIFKNNQVSLIPRR
jgi:hypothetical protein